MVSIMMFEYFDYLAISISLTLLCYSSWSDWRTREVTNAVWLILAPIGATLTFFRIFQTQNWMLYLLWALIIGVITAVSLMLFYFGLWGGADSKAFICLSLLFPWPPTAFKPLLGIQLPLFPFTILNDTLLLSISAILYILAKNIIWKISNQQSIFERFENEPSTKKILALLAGYKVKKEKLQKHHLTLLERFTVEKENKIISKWSFELKIEEENGKEEPKFEQLPEEVWVSPQIPMMIFITLGTITAILGGDLLLWLIAQVIP